MFVAEQASAKEILNLMMFYEAAGGYGFAHLPNRYQAYCDLSRHAGIGPGDPGRRSGDGPAAELVDDANSGERLATSRTNRTVVYRFVLPVKYRSRDLRLQLAHCRRSNI